VEKDGKKDVNSEVFCSRRTPRFDASDLYTWLLYVHCMSFLCIICIWKRYSYTFYDVLIALYKFFKATPISKLVCYICYIDCSEPVS
jgi:uncharacterized membrane protein